MQRFDHNAKDVAGSVRYLFNRSTQLLMDGFELSMLRPLYHDKKTLGALAVYNKQGKTYHSYYIIEGMRGKGYYSEVQQEYSGRIITIPDCNMEEFLRAKEIPFKLACTFTQNPHYQWIERVYGNTRAKRSQCFYMDHIDEGLALLQSLKCDSHHAKEAWCLHPIIQVNKHLLDAAKDLKGSTTIDPYSVMLATEYRNLANAYLPSMGVRPAKDIRLSEVADVNTMLVADKIQNRKQFEQHREKFKNADVLDSYFKSWLERLEVPEELYQELADMITVSGGIPTDQRVKRWRNQRNS